MNKKILITILFIVVIGVLIWFGFIQKKEQPKVNKEPIKIGIVVSPATGPWLVAQEKRFFQDENVNAEIVLISDENQLVSSLVSNQVQVLVSTPDFTTIIADAGVDAPQILAIDIGLGSDGLVVKNDVNDITELKGKQVHLSFGTPSYLLFRFLEEKSGLKSEDVELINGTADQIGAGFVAGQIDYGMTWEPWLSKASERKDGKILWTSREEPGIITDTMVARRDAIEKKREDIKAVMRAFFRAIDYWKNNPNEANTIMAKSFNIPVEEYVSMMEHIQPLDYNGNLQKFDRSTKFNLFELTEKAATLYFEDGIIQSKPDVNKLIDDSLLKELY